MGYAEGVSSSLRKGTVTMYQVRCSYHVSSNETCDVGLCTKSEMYGTVQYSDHVSSSLRKGTVTMCQVQYSDHVSSNETFNVQSVVYEK